MRKNSGLGLLTITFIIVIFSALIAGLVVLFASTGKLSVEQSRYEKAFFIAESGKAYAMKHLSGYADWTQPMGFPLSKSFGGGEFIVTISSPSTEAITLLSTGIITIEGKAYIRKIELIITISRLNALNNYAMYFGSGGTGGGGTTMIGSNVLINGDIYTNSNIFIGSNATINGDAYSSGDMTLGSNVTITGSQEENVPPPSNPPELDTTYYDQEIAYASNNIAPASYAYSTKTFTGNTYINGNLTFNNNCNISITGSAKIVVTGTVTINNNARIGNNLTVISQGQISFGNNDMAIGTDCLWYSSTGIDVDNNATIGSLSSGNGSSFISPGDISLGNNNTYNGLIFCSGTLNVGSNNSVQGNILAGFVENIGSNTRLTLNPSLVGGGTITGLTGGGESIVSNWHEIF